MSYLTPNASFFASCAADGRAAATAGQGTIGSRRAYSCTGEVELARRAVNLRIHLGRLVVALCRVFRLEELPKALYLLPHLLLGSVQEVAHAPHLHG